MSPVREAVRVDGQWFAIEGPIREVAPPLPPSLDFTVGETQPTPQNTGAGVIRPYPTIVVNGNVTVQPGQVYADRIINGRVTILGDGVLENCVVRGSATAPTGQTYLVNTSGATPTSPTVPLTVVADPATPGGYRAPTFDDDPDTWIPNPAIVDNVRFCTIDPQTPSAWINAFGTKFTRAYRCAVRGTVDGWRVYSTVDGWVGTRIRGCHATGFSQFQPDIATGGRPVTHDDWIQAEANTSPPWDFVVHGNAFNARPDPAKSNPTATIYSELAAIMLTANVDLTVNGVVVRAINVAVLWNWLTGGVNTLNAGKTVTVGGYAHIIYVGNRHERPGFPISPGGGPTIAVGIDPNYVVDVYRDNVYIDNGAAVPRTNG